MNNEKTISHRIMCAGRSGKGLSFFGYAESLSPETSIGKKPAPPIPLHHIFSLMRALECDVVVEEELDPATVSGCAKEVDILQEKLRPELNPLSRRVFRITFFKVSKNDIKCVDLFQTDHDRARDTAEEDKRTFLSIKESLECLGFLYLYADSCKGINLSAYVPRAVVRPLPSDDYRGLFIHSKAEFLAHVFEGITFPVEGSFFAQQEGSTWCCAHAAVLTLMMNITGATGDLKRSFCVQQWNSLLGIDHEYRNAGGLSPDEIRRIFANEGVQSFCADYDTISAMYTFKGSAAHADRVIATAYYAVEAGLPAIIGFAGEHVDHAMAVVGHTFDPSMWSPTATRAYFDFHDKPYIPSHAWVDNLVVQDDNLGPYCTLPRSVLQACNPRVIIPKFPNSKWGTPEVVEWAAADLLALHTYEQGRFFQTILRSVACPSREKNKWFFRLMRNVSTQTHVLRTIPITHQEYFDFLTGKNDLDEQLLGKGSDNLTDTLKRRQEDPITLTWRQQDPSTLEWRQRITILKRRQEDPFSWLVEISIPELFQWNNRRLGEVIFQESTLVNAESQEEVDFLDVWLVRVPGILSVPNLAILDNGEITYRFNHYQIPGKNHYPIVTRTVSDFARSWLGPS